MSESKPVSKTDFIRQHAVLSTAEVIAKGRARGIALDQRFVNAVKREARTKSNARAARENRGQAAGETRALVSSTTTPGGPRGKKISFVLAQPASMRTMDVIALAARNGIKVSRAHVYRIRGATRDGQTYADAAASEKRAPSNSIARDGRLHDLVIELGVLHVKTALAEIENKLKAYAARP